MGILKNKSARMGLIAVGLATVVGGFQNCSKAQFTASEGNFDSLSVASLPPTNVALSPLVCSAGDLQSATAQQYYPTPCLKDPMLAQNSVGLEMNNNYLLKHADGSANVFVLDSDSIAGTIKDVQLYVEVATYAAPDSVVLYAVDAHGNETKILDICNIATYSKGDPTKGLARPYSDNILQFNVVLPRGTRHLKYDFSNALTPTYVGVWNLGEFSQALANPASNPFPALKSTYANNFRPASGLPAALNDNVDPVNAGTQICQ